jgi:hypothetical protein
MKEEYRKKLDEMYVFLKNYNSFPDIESTQNVLESVFLPNMEFLAATKDQEVLEHLFDFFDEEFDCEINEVCETLQSMIGENFTLDQMIKAFYEKLDSFAEKYLGKCVEMSMCCVRNRQINDGHWDRFREMFNTVKSKHSKAIVERLKALALKYDWEEDSKQMVYALEEDMKKW